MKTLLDKKIINLIKNNKNLSEEDKKTGEELLASMNSSVYPALYVAFSKNLKLVEKFIKFGKKEKEILDNGDENKLEELFKLEIEDLKKEL